MTARTLMMALAATFALSLATPSIALADRTGTQTKVDAEWLPLILGAIYAVKVGVCMYRTCGDCEGSSGLNDTVGCMIASLGPAVDPCTTVADALLWELPEVHADLTAGEYCLTQAALRNQCEARGDTAWAAHLNAETGLSTLLGEVQGLVKEALWGLYGDALADAAAGKGVVSADDTTAVNAAIQSEFWSQNAATLSGFGDELYDINVHGYGYNDVPWPACAAIEEGVERALGGAPRGKVIGEK